MKRSYYFAIAIVVGALLASVLLDDPGRVTIAIHGWLIDMTLPAALLLLAALWLVLRTVKRLWRFAQRQVQEKTAQQQVRSYEQLAQGLIQFSAGNWLQAEQTLTRSAFGSAHPVVHYLAAARAAELLGATERRNEWLTKALDAAPGERGAVHVSHAEMLLKHNQLEAAQTLLEQLDVSGHQNTRGLMLLARIYRQQGDWQKLKVLEPQLRRTPGLPAESVDEVLAQVHLDMLKAAGTACDGAQLAAAWREVPKSMADRPDVIVTYARSAMNCGQHALAEKTLAALLDTQWYEAAAIAYGDVEPPEPLAQLHTIEKWLNQRPQDAALLFTAARCCARNELYGKARSYLEASIGIKPRLESYQLLAQLLELSGERERAFQVLNDAMTQAVGRRPLLPKLRAQRLMERRRGGDRRNQ
jgi:HemY protein